MQPTAPDNVRPASRPSEMPGWLLKIGKYSVPVTVLFSLDLIYEQTLLTWSSGEQMVGFSMMHLFGPIIFLSVLMTYVFLIGVAIFLTVCRLRKRTLPPIPWPLILTLCIAIGITYIPYRRWQNAVIKVKGPGPRAAQTFVWAAHDGDRRMVETLLDSGVPVDIDNQGSTALNGACAGHQIELARWLISKGADIRLAPECKGVPIN